MKIAFLLPVVSDARAHKRISGLKKFGARPVVLAFERKYYKGKPFPEGYISLSAIEHSKYHKRLIPFLKAFVKVRAAVKKTDVIYAFGLDMLLLGWLACLGPAKPFTAVYEVADIREVLLGKGLLSRCLRWLERFLLRRTKFAVVTSERYISGYYQEIQGIKDFRYIVVENKIDPVVTAKAPACPIGENAGILRIGYFGVIRCRRSLDILMEAALQSSGRVQVYLRGFPLGVGDLEKVVQSPAVTYGGPYMAPDDLPDLYGRVDLVWACYPYRGNITGNQCWARTNRFYESCYFNKPMLAQAGTEDGRVIEALGLGTCLDLADSKAAVKRILSITGQELKQWQYNTGLLDKEIYIMTSEHAQLWEMLTQELSAREQDDKTY
ncbi:glycosyltransferase family protein [Desulfotruncus alcoholivorax]|uniref:hypothetical protein n=1 Tax=Desulfotruncus alcoholivorax TaxID=265477 RepID=UPI000410775C|nr:hypothetical protein [Desulfotruncus alcoholivorax]